MIASTIMLPKGTNQTMYKKYRVMLTSEQRQELHDLLATGQLPNRANTHARILLKADCAPGGPAWSDAQISDAYDVSIRSIVRVREAFVKAGLRRAVERQPPTGRRPGKVDGRVEAHVIALACSAAPPGHVRWTLRLLSERVVALLELDSLSRERVRQILKESKLKPWVRQCWCLPPGAHAGFVAQMEEILDLYQEPPDPRRPLVCVDESQKEQRSEVRTAEPMAPAKPYRYDHEYEHNGRSNLFLMFAPHANWRHVKVTDQRTAADFAECMRDLVDAHFPQAEVIRLVVDNLNTHSKASLYAHFPPEEAHRIARKLEFHYTPKHGSWLDMAEIELAVLGRQCLNQRIPDQDTLSALVAAWELERNEAQATIRWVFTTADARIKLEHLYPCLEHAK